MAVYHIGVFDDDAVMKEPLIKKQSSRFFNITLRTMVENIILPNRYATLMDREVVEGDKSMVIRSMYKNS